MSLYREDIHNYYSERGYEFIPEKSLDNSEEGNTLVGSSIMANMDLLDQQSKVKKYTIQRVFSSNRMEDIGEYPLATPYETMISIFDNNDNSVEFGVNSILNFLSLILDRNVKEFYYLSPNLNVVNDSLRELNLPKEQVISWGENIELNLGDNQNTGLYLKIFMDYKNGVMPIGTIGFLKLSNGNFFIDSALFLERLSFVSEDLDNWFSDIYYDEIYNFVKNNYQENSDVSKRRITILSKSLGALYLDGINLDNNGKGYITKKTLKLLINEIFPYDEKIISLMEISLDTILKYSDNTSSTSINKNELLKLFLTDYKKIKKGYKNSYKDTEKFIKKYSNKKIEYEHLHGTFGATKNMLKNINKRIDDDTFKIVFPEKEKKFWFRNECYKFSENKITNPRIFLIESEEKRLRN